MTPPSKNVVRLVRRPVLEDNESLRGYMLRLDAENCLKMFSNELTTLSAATKAIGDVAYATNCRESALRNRLTITYSNALRVPEADIFGVTVPLRWINRIAKKICPMCLLEVGHMSIFWEIRLIKTCFIHSAFLITDCQQCHKPLTWNMGTLHSCKCGALLTSFLSKPAPESCLLLDLLLSESFRPMYVVQNYLFDTGYGNILEVDAAELMEQFSILGEVIIPSLKGVTTSIPESTRNALDAQLVISFSLEPARSLETLFFVDMLNELKSQGLWSRVKILRKTARSPFNKLIKKYKFKHALLETKFMETQVLPAWHRAQQMALTSLREDLSLQDEKLEGLSARLVRQQTKNPIPEWMLIVQKLKSDILKQRFLYASDVAILNRINSYSTTSLLPKER